MNKRRLQTLANFLAETKFESGKFHLGMWMGTYQAFSERIPICDADPTMKAVRQRLAKIDDSESNFDVTRGVYDARPISCRTVGCALGWAATIPSFRKAGLKLRYQSGVKGDLDAHALPCFEHYHGYDAAEVFFDVDYNIARALFSPDNYTPGRTTQPEGGGETYQRVAGKG